MEKSEIGGGKKQHRQKKFNCQKKREVNRREQLTH
jgi:hypothetical protein